MTFKDATDKLCRGVTHEDLAKALGVSVAAVRQARLNPEAKAFRHPPAEWRSAVLRIAEERTLFYRQLVKDLLKDEA